MKFDSLTDLIFDGLKSKMGSHKGLSLFARERSKFEGWLKVELCDSLLKQSSDVYPEEDGVDISVDKWGIELKTVNTNYRMEGIKNKSKPITDNISGVINDIEKLKKSKFAYKAVLFVAFPTRHDKKEWQIHLAKIRKHLDDMKHCSFNFENGKPGVIYCGLV